MVVVVVVVIVSGSGGGWEEVVLAPQLSAFQLPGRCMAPPRTALVSTYHPITPTLNPVCPLFGGNCSFTQNISFQFSRYDIYDLSEAQLLS